MLAFGGDGQVVSEMVARRRQRGLAVAKWHYVKVLVKELSHVS